MHKHLAPFAALALGLALAGCDTYSYPTPQPEKRQMEANERVYGTPGGPPKQAANKYETNPDAAAKAQELKGKLFNTGGETLKSDTSKPAPLMGE